MAQRASAGAAPGSAANAAPSRADAALAAHLEVAARYGVTSRATSAKARCACATTARRFAASSPCRPPNRCGARPRRARPDAHRMHRPDDAGLRSGPRSTPGAPTCSTASTGRACRHDEEPHRDAPRRRLERRRLPARAARRRAPWPRPRRRGARSTSWRASTRRARRRRPGARTTTRRSASAPRAGPPIGLRAATTAPAASASSPRRASRARPACCSSTPGTTASAPLARRCTYGIVWAASASLNREGNALTLAVQPMDAWRELWVFRKKARRLGAAGPAAVDRVRPSSATSSSPAGCRAAGRCWSRAKRAATAS